MRQNPVQHSCKLVKEGTQTNLGLFYIKKIGINPNITKFQPFVCNILMKIVTFF
jgi:hypothetical protein